jgi:hypothetical protein
VKAGDAEPRGYRHFGHARRAASASTYRARAAFVFRPRQCNAHWEEHLHRINNRRGMAAVIAATLVAAACTDPSSTDLSTALVVGSARYEMVSGDQQSAPAGAELPAPLVVRVTSASGAAVPGQLVNWVITEGNGSVFAGRAITDANGIAQEWWTLGATPGANALEVRAVDSSTGEAHVFGRFRATGTDSTVTEAPAAPTTISISARTYKVKGLQKVELGWSGASSTSVEIHRDGGLLVRSPNDGKHVDNIDGKGSASYRYRVCEVGTSACSAEVQVSF